MDDTSKRETRLNELEGFLLKQNYPIALIKNGIERAKAIPIDILRKTVEKEENENIIPFVFTHNPLNPDIFRTAKSNLPIIQESQKLKDLI